MNAFGVPRQTKQDAAAQEAKALAEFMRGMAADAMMCAVIDNLASRTDFDPVRLEEQANQIGRIAHERARA